jgi:diguanylate cyclase (GGDEF)-like protein
MVVHMKKSWKISLLISLIVFLGALVTGIITYTAYSKVLKDSTRNIAELSAMNIYSKIDNELTKPIYVSLTMAHDTFLKEWLSREDSTNQNQIIAYLNGVHEKYDYNSVFLVSSTTSIYYYFDGVNKILSPEDSHDVWYYDFINGSDAYLLDVDVDEVTGVLTIFINAKVFDESENLIAVVGVGVEMDYVINIMQDFEQHYDLKIYLVDELGLVQSSTDISLIENKNIIDDFDANLTEEIFANQTDLLTQSTTGDSKYIISRYIDDLNWYVLVEKNTNLFERFFIDYFWLSVIMIVTVLIIVSNIVIFTINNYQKHFNNLAKTDYLTLLLNRRGFIEEIDKLSLGQAKALIFMTDVDGFKQINDQYGHSTGDEVLKYIASVLETEVSKYGKLSRWGGDEFTGVMLGDKSELETGLSQIIQTIQSDHFLQEKKISISIGYSFTDFSVDLDTTLCKVDQALYEAKSKGGNTVVYKE